MRALLGGARSRDALVAAGLFLAHALLAAPLFAGPYTRWRQSIESAFIADARFIVDRFPDLSWSPLWYLGFPFELFYTPLLQAVTALLGAANGDVASAYRVVAATGLALAAPGAYVLARACGAGRPAAVLASALFSCAPLASYLLPGLLADGQGVTGSAIPLPWRLVILVEYGEGPHVLGLSLSLFAAAAALRYLRAPTRAWLWGAAALLAAVALTNLIAILGAAVLATMATLAPRGGRERVLHGLRLAGATALLSIVWYSPGFVLAVGGFSTPGGEGGGAGYLAFPVAIAAAALAGRFLLGAQPGPAMLLSSGLVFAAILVAWYAGRVALAPQPVRYAAELDVVVAIGVALLVERALPLARSLRPAAPRILSGAAALVLVASVPGWIAVRPALEPDPAWSDWSERKVAAWLADHVGPDERAFLSGSHAFWLNAFEDVPQVRGGVDFASTTPWWAHATYQITTGSDARISAMWLRALGARYAVVTGPDSRDAFRDFAKPDMFEGVLPLATTIDGARIYESADPRASPVLIEERADPPAPRDALDAATLERYLAAIDGGAPQARLDLRREGPDRWEGEIDTGGRPLTLLLRTAHDSGWQVRLNGMRVATRRDTIGLLAVDVPAGVWRATVDHRIHTDLLATNVLAWGALAVLALRRGLRAVAGRRALPAAVIAGTVAAYALALGAITGYPKGTDAPMHVARLRFVAEWFPDHDWLYAWAAGMPTFDTYPALPYLAAIPLTHLVGAERVLQLLALGSMLALGLGLYGHLVERGRPAAVATLAALLAVTSLATWTWILNGGVYARVVAVGIGAIAWWTHARALRGDGRGWWAATAVLLAAAVASHQVMGAVAALYVAAVHLSARRLGGLPRLALLAGTSLLIAAPAILPTLVAGGRGILGVVREDLAPVEPAMLFSPVHVGFAAFTLPLAALVAGIAQRPWRVLLAGAALAAVLAYAIAPALRIPTRFSYVAGIDPVTTTFLIALAGALVFAALVPDGAAARPLIALAALLVVANAVFSVPLFTAQRTYPQVVDTTAPSALEAISRRTLVVDGGDLRHRILPFSAYESVWFTAEHRKPMLRHYYDQGVVHPDWLAWAFGALYTPPLDPARARSAAEWYALDSFTVPADLAAERELAALEWTAPVASTMTTPFHQYSVADPEPIVVASSAPLVVVIGDRFAYDRTTRLLFDGGATPGTRIPVWHDGTLADLPDDLRESAAAAIVVGDRVGDGGGEVAAAMAARGAAIVWDVSGLPDGVVFAPWPVAGVRAQAIASFDVRDRLGRVSAGAFSPAVYDGGPWGAQVATGLRDGAVAELTLGPDTIVASVPAGSGSLVVVGGNLFFHALAYANGAERAYVLSFLGPAAADAAVEPEWTFVDPEERRIETDGRPVVVKESFHPGWSATLRDAGGAERAVPVRYAGPGLMAVLPPGEGTLTLRYGGSPAGTAGLLLAAAGLALAAWAGLGHRLRGIRMALFRGQMARSGR